jgi:hypothetical protein
MRCGLRAKRQQKHLPGTGRFPFVGGVSCAWSVGTSRGHLCLPGVYRDEIPQAGAPRVCKAGPGRDYWVKEIRRKEMDYVERAYERMVHACTRHKHNAGFDRAKAY